MFEYWISFIATFLIFIIITFIIYSLGRKSKIQEKMKDETYTCGEPFPNSRISPDNFYRALKRVTGIKDLRELHSGKLNDYLIWFIVGVAVIIVFVVWA